MAVQVTFEEDTECRITESGTEIVREKVISAATLADALSSKQIPAYGTRHPVFTNLRLVSGSVQRSGNDGGKWQGFWSGTYASSDAGGKLISGVDPWDLGAHEFSKDPFPIEVPMIGGWDKNGEYHRLLNSAGCMLQRQQTIYGYSYKFIYCIQAKNSAPSFGDMAIVNSASCKVAGETFPAYRALLLPPSVDYREEYDEEGNVKRAYWEISVEIRTHPVSWETETLNVGTMAKFKDDAGNIKKLPEQIYKYTPWKKNPANDTNSENFKTKPVFGSIDDVVKAKHEYAKIVSGGSRNDAYYKAYNELPWEEVTEPLPLRLDGTVYTEAMEDPTNNEYYVVALFDTQLGSFSQFNLPTKRGR